MERPKKINTSFLLLLVLFILTQTAHALSASVSYDVVNANVQGNAKEEYELLIENISATNFAQPYISTGASSNLDLSASKASASEDISLFSADSVPASADINYQESEIVINSKLNKIIPATFSSTSEPEPEIKSVVMHVNTDKLNVREEPTSESKLVTSIKRGDKVTYYETIGDWARIITWTDRKGYILAKYLVDSADKVERPKVSRSATTKTTANTAQTQTKTAPASDTTVAAPQPQADEGESLADKIIDYSKTLLGVPYVWSGYSKKGFDCSGFTKYVFAKFGIALPRSSYEYYSIGTKVSRSELQKGDILLWDIDKNGTVGHVGIYLGNGMFIHASSSKGKVVTRSVDSYSEKYIGARRVID